ncbi:Putative uncharacterized transposon-derived protein F52C9.6 [Eumeta japonica]|uniref:Uncharacterized transposon-derived protein F52C9.6 n=1 Tax=Eumeta variegata TaxID=151549 RepID=A0A4C1W9G0_EUMVA|nr:Putative uncharacterized transposon-derived protein F52C9.6 [Eumeta japonica]
MKKIIMDSCILPTLTYSSQTWIFTNTIKNKIRSCQHAMERSILKLRRIDKKRNTDIRNKTKLVDALQHTMTLKWKWAGHIARYQDKDGLHKQLIGLVPLEKEIGDGKRKDGPTILRKLRGKTGQLLLKTGTTGRRWRRLLPEQGPYNNVNVQYNTY